MHTINKLSKTDWAWLAGFIDGDGCIGIYESTKGGYWVPRVTVAQKDQAVLFLIADMLGTGSVHGHQLTLGSGVSKQVCKGIRPYLKLVEKQRRCDEVLALEAKVRYDKAETRQDADQAEAWYTEGVPVKEIANRLATKPATVGYWLRQRGVTRSFKEAQVMRRQRERT